jgi:DNA repair protein RecN (Recombination protein N)
LGRRLVDLHGQHAHQSLLAPVEQRALLDRACGERAAAARGRVRDARHEARRIDDERAGLGGDERARAREIDLLRYQLAEIDAAEITGVHEAEALTADADILADAEAHRGALAAAYETLEGAAEDAVGRAAASSRVGRRSRRSRNGCALQAEIAEAREVRMALESVVIDPERLAAVQARRAPPGADPEVRTRARRGARVPDRDRDAARGGSRPTTPGRPRWTRRGRPRSPVLGGPPRT